MLIEMAVFGRQQRIHQQIREAATRNKQALLAVRRREHGYQTRIETEETELAVVIHILNGIQMIAIKGQTRTHLPFFTVREVKRTADHLNALRLHGKFARARHFRHLTVLCRLQQFHHLVLADGHFWLKVNHPAIYRRRKLPDFAINTATDFLVQIHAIYRDQHQKDNRQFYQQPEPATLTTRLTPFALTLTRHRFFILIVIIIIVVILVISELTTAHLLFHRTRWFPFTSNWLAVIPRHAFSPQHSGAKARFSVLPSGDRRRNLSIITALSPDAA